jgi:hypothetical protein
MKKYKSLAKYSRQLEVTYSFEIYENLKNSGGMID